MEDLNIRKIFVDICNGYSVGQWNNYDIYIKHLSILETVELNDFYEKNIEIAQKNGIKKRQERLDWLNEKGLWGKVEEQELDKQKDYIDNLTKTKERLFISSQIKIHQKLLDEESAKLNKLLNKKESLIGSTAEKIADQKVQFYYMYISFYKEKLLNNRFFTKEYIDSLDDEESFNLLGFYIKIIEKFGNKNIEKIAISNFFTNSFYICGDNIKDFFGKPIYLLTNYQSNLLSYGLYFKNIISSNPDLPDNIKDDPEKIKDFIRKNRNLDQALKYTKPGQRVGLVGASKQDIEDLGGKVDTSFLNKKGPINEK